MNKFTVIVNTYPNLTRNEDLKKCLDSLFKQNYQDFCVLIVENYGDTSKIKEILSKYENNKERITVINNPAKKLSFLFNLGWKSVKTDYLAFLADDATADIDWLKNIDLELGKDDKVGIASGPVISSCFPAGEMHRIYLLSQKNIIFRVLTWPYLYFAAERKIHKPGSLFESGAYSFGTSLKESVAFERQEIDLATTTSMGVRRDVLEKVGGFDENFSFNHADGDLFIRIKKLGYKIIFNPKIIAYHNVRIGPSRNAYVIGLDTGKFYRKDVRPKTIRGWVGALINISVLNSYWIYNFLRTNDLKQLKGVTGFFEGLFSKPKIKTNTDRKLSILFINRWVGYNEGGNETHIKDLMDQFSRKGHSVTVMTTEGTALDYLKDKISIEFVKGKKEYFSNKVFGIFGAAIYLIKLFFKFFKLYLKGNRYDVLSVHFSLEAFFARFVKLFFGIPYVLVLAGDTSLELIEGRRADGKIAISNFMNDQCKKYSYSAEIIPKGIDLSRFSPNVDFSDLYQKGNFSEKNAILTVARLEPRKNLLTLVKAADEIVNKKGVKNIVFFIIGEGVERNILEENVRKLGLESYVKLLGAISNSDPTLAKYYAASQLFVLPTLYEGFGWVFLEAMSAGLPIITTKVGSNIEVVGDIGVLIEPKNPNLLAEAILYTLNDKDKLMDMRKIGLEKARNYSWDNVMVRCEKYYKDTSERKCKKVTCKLKVLGYVVIDLFEITLKAVKGKYSEVNNNVGGEWSGLGQEGIKN